MCSWRRGSAVTAVTSESRNKRTRGQGGGRTRGSAAVLYGSEAGLRCDGWGRRLLSALSSTENSEGWFPRTRAARLINFSTPTPATVSLVPNRWRNGAREGYLSPAEEGRGRLREWGAAPGWGMISDGSGRSRSGRGNMLLSAAQQSPVQP